MAGNRVTFDIFVKDLGSGPLATFSKNVEKTVRRVNKSVGSLNGILGKTGGQVKRVDDQFKRLGSRKLGLDKQLRSANGQLDLMANKLNRLRTSGAMGGGRRGGGMGGMLLGGSLMSTLGMYAGPLAIGMGLKSAVQTGTELQSVMVDIRGILSQSDGFGDEAFQGMMKNMQQLGADTVFTTPEIYKATKVLSMAGFNIDQINKSMPSVASIAAVGNMDTEKAANIIAGIQAGYGIKADNMNNVADVLVKTFTGARVTLEQLGESYAYAGNKAATAGVDFKETAAFLGALNAGGLQGSRGGTNFRQMLIRMTAPTAGAEKAMKRLGITFTEVAEDGTTKLKSLNQIVKEVKKSGATASDLKDIFGVYGGEAFNVASTMKTQDGKELLIDKLVRDNEQAGGLAKALAAQKMKTFSGTIQKLNAQWEIFSNLLFIKVEPILTKVMNKLIGFFEYINANDGSKLNDTITILGNTLRITYGVLRAFFHFIKDNWGWLSKLTGLILLVVGAYKLYAAVLGIVASAQAAVILLNPVGLIIAGIVALIATIIHFWQTWDEFRAVILGIWEVFKEVFQNIGNTFKVTFQPIMDAMLAMQNPDFSAWDKTKAIAKSMAQLSYNMTPIGMAHNGIKEIMKTDFSGSWNRGWQRGMDPNSKIDMSWLTKKFEGIKIGDIGPLSKTGDVGSEFDVDLGAGNGEGGGSGSGSGSGSGVKGFKSSNSATGAGIIVYIQNLMNVETETLLDTGTGELAEDIKTKISAALMEVVKDVEISYSS